MSNLKDDMGIFINQLSSKQIRYCLSLPKDHIKWTGCPYPLDVVYEAMENELSYRKEA